MIPRRDIPEPFKRKLEQLLNSEGLDNETNTPDSLLAELVWDTLETYRITQYKARRMAPPPIVSPH